MSYSVSRRLFAIFVTGVLASLAIAAERAFDRTPRVAIISAFQPELTTLLANVKEPKKHVANGVEFTTGMLGGKRVVLFLSGISMTNAAMNTQLVLDRFNVTHIVFSGIAGGVNPALNVGDVVVAERWGQYMEIVAAREVSPDKFAIPSWMDAGTMANYGMMHPRPVGVRSKGRAKEEKKFWFDADPKLLAMARALGDVPLADCDEKKVCLTTQPKLLVRQRRFRSGFCRQRGVSRIRVQNLQRQRARHGNRRHGDGRLRQRRALHRVSQPERSGGRRQRRERNRDVFQARCGQFGEGIDGVLGGVEVVGTRIGFFLQRPSSTGYRLVIGKVDMTTFCLLASMQRCIPPKVNASKTPTQ